MNDKDLQFSSLLSETGYERKDKRQKSNSIYDAFSPMDLTEYLGCADVLAPSSRSSRRRRGYPLIRTESVLDPGEQSICVHRRRLSDRYHL